MYVQHTITQDSCLLYEFIVSGSWMMAARCVAIQLDDAWVPSHFDAVVTIEAVTTRHFLHSSPHNKYLFTFYFLL